jgi:hypothetical protein
MQKYKTALICTPCCVDVGILLKSKCILSGLDERMSKIRYLLFRALYYWLTKKGRSAKALLPDIELSDAL